MDKKDIYEHLASIYLDASAKRKTKHKKYSPVFKNLFFASIAVIVLLGVFLFSGSRRNQPHHSEVALLLSQEPVKINFHFDPAKKEIFSLNLNKLNTQRFNELVFSLKKINSRDAIKLKVEFANLFKERSEIYLKDVPVDWQEFRFTLSDFKNINDWSEMARLSFIIEEWNTKEKSGVVYIDNIRLVR